MQGVHLGSVVDKPILVTFYTLQSTDPPYKTVRLS